MKQLLLLRHAKSDWSTLDLKDHDRPLNKRGHKNAISMGEYFNKCRICPATILCSTAVRTQETLKIITTTTNWEPAVHFDKALYGADRETLMAQIQACHNDYDSLMIVAHNPGIEDLAIALTGTDESHLLPKIFAKVPTGSLITLNFAVSGFHHINLKGGTLVSFIRPQIELAAKSSHVFEN